MPELGLSFHVDWVEGELLFGANEEAKLCGDTEIADGQKCDLFKN